MISTPKPDKNVEGDCESTGSSPQTGHGFSGHKASFRSTKLARRARSFKEDILEKFSQIRSPGSTPGLRSQSPKSRPNVTIIKQEPILKIDKNNTKELDIQLHQIQLALKHFKDVISKLKIEILPGNGTVVLEIVTAIHTALKHCLSADGSENQSTVISSATHQVYQSLARFLELCDETLLYGEKSPSLEMKNVSEVITFFENSIKNLVKLSQEKLNNQDTHKPYIQRKYSAAQNSLDIPGQRNSLPDIPLTPKERQILEQTCGTVHVVRNSHSSESILRDTSPPPKPPLPSPICLSGPDTNNVIPPPIPPKKRGPRGQHLLDDCNSFDNSLLGCSFDRISLRSRSPEDSNSLLSTTSVGSVDSVLMQSRDEEEMKALMDPKHEEIIRQSDLAEIMNDGIDCIDYVKWNDSLNNSGASRQENSINNFTDLHPFGDGNRLSASESGFGSMRSSIQSYSTSSASTRSSQQSSNSAKWVCKQTSQAGSVTQQKTENRFKTHSSSSYVQNLKSEQQVIAESSVSSVIKRETSVQSISRTLTSSSTITNINEFVGPEAILDFEGNPPALPVKLRTKQISKERPSQYDNVQSDSLGEHIVTCALHQSQATTMSSICSKTDKSNSTSPEHDPPPLPPKKKHIMAYMEMFGNCSHTAINNGDFSRHSVHTYNVMQSEWHSEDDVGENEILNQSIQSSQSTTLSSTQSCSFNYDNSISPVIQRLNTSQLHGTRRPMTCSPAINSPESKPITPPALPPKKSRISSHTRLSTPPHSPSPIISPSSLSTSPVPLNSYSPTNNDIKYEINDNKTTTTVNNTAEKQQNQNNKIEVNDNNVNNKQQNDVANNYEENDLDLLDLLDVTEYLIYKKPDEDGPDLRGGHPDALIVHATKSNKNDFKYQEAFLTTYRTFLTPEILIWKLQERHQRFSCHSNVLKQRAAKESFSLLVSVVNDLTFPVQILVDEEDGKKYPEFTSQNDKKLLQTLMEFEYQLVCSGDLNMAKALRVKILERFAISQLHAIPPNKYLTSINTTSSSLQLLDFKSEQIAEQMTLLDADLFMRIEISEILIWAQEQKEDLSPNLTRFTEHFNKMSYWARSRILEQNDAKDRERYVVKFIKIMKHLRKMNNFNSYLALLSALDSAPIRRLEWQKQITEGLKEYCALIDSSSSFRAYRQALSETQPPCIPYIGLILQDLTFVNIGNSDLLPDGNINFSKRWQQFNILDNMKRFKKGMYSFKKQERLILFLNDFEPCMSEEEMWQISETIKPRGSRKVPT